MRWRLGLPCAPPGCMCRRCGRGIDPRPSHVLVCKHSEGKCRPPPHGGRRAPRALRPRCPPRGREG
eukprot:10043728-Alexandrium_andersonii.AAC.1